jgi:hypothetical protein
MYAQIYISSGLHSRRVISVTHCFPFVIFDSLLVSTVSSLRLLKFQYGLNNSYFCYSSMNNFVRSHELFMSKIPFYFRLKPRQQDQCISFSVVFTPSSPQPPVFWLLPVISLLLTNTVSRVRACLSI